MTGYGFPYIAPPIPDGDPANAPKWWRRFLSPTSDALDQVNNGDTGWINATLAGAWANYGSIYAPASYRLLHGTVWLRGLVKLGAVGTIFTLPAGFRPMLGAIFPQVAAVGLPSSGLARVDCLATGVVKVTQYSFGGGNAYVSLDGINFDQAQ